VRFKKFLRQAGDASSCSAKRQLDDVQRFVLRQLVAPGFFNDLENGSC
jgi:hypothetical protein